MVSIAELKKDLRQGSGIKEASVRGASVAAIIAEALRTIGQDPVLVGGGAVEFYNRGGYATADIDMVTFGGDEAVGVMKQLGFTKIGKDFVNRDLKLYVEFPSETLASSERADIVQVGTRSLRIISLEDLIVDRLCSYKFWQSGIDGVNALLLLELGETDKRRVIARACEEDVKDELDAVEGIREAVIRKHLSRKQAGKLLEEKMRELKNKSVV